MNRKVPHLADTVSPEQSPTPPEQGAASLTLEIFSGPQQGVDIEALPKRFLVGINREDAEYLLFSAQNVTALIEFSGYVEGRLDMRVIDGEVLLGGARVASEHAKSSSLPFNVKVGDIEFGLRECVSLSSVAAPRLAESVSTAFSSQSLRRPSRSRMQIAVACLFGAVVANHQYGFAVSSSAPSIVQASAVGTLASRHSDTTLEFIQRAQYFGLTELILKPHPEHARTVTGTGYVRNDEELASVGALAAELGISFSSNVSKVSALQALIASALAESRSSATVAYLGGGRFQVSSLRAEIPATRDAIARCLRGDRSIVAVSLLTTDSHRSNEREIGVEIAAPDAVAAKPAPRVETDEKPQPYSESTFETPKPSKSVRSERNQFSSVLLNNGHRVYGRSPPFGANGTTASSSN
jgi:hypothetical protein